MILDQFIQTKQQVPLLNYASQIMGLPAFRDFSQVNRKKRLMALAKRSPELYGMVRNIASDIAGPFYFEPTRLHSSGRNKILKAQAFSKHTRLKKLLKNLLIDALITGEWYLFKGFLSSEMQKQLKRELRASPDSAFSDVDEDLTKPRYLRQAASTSMAVQTDGRDITSYVQKVYGVEQEFNTDEIIRFTFEELDGKVEGYSIINSLQLPLELLWLMWQNQYYNQAKGNHPDFIVTMEGMGIDANHPSFKQVEQTLKEYNTPQNATHGSFLFSGPKLAVTQLQRDKDLEFKDVGQYIVNQMAMMWDYPQQRLGIKTDQSAKSKDTAGTGSQDYWRHIEEAQEQIAIVLDMELWEPYFGVQMKFKKRYYHDLITEATAKQSLLTNLKMQQEVLKQYGYGIKRSALINLLNTRDLQLNEEDVEERESFNDVSGAGSTPQGSMPNPESVEKRDLELQREQLAGKPNGV